MTGRRSIYFSHFIFMSNRHLNLGEEQHVEINRGKGADVAQKAGEDFGKPSGPRTVLPLQPRALRAWRQPQGPFGSSLQLNNLLMTIAEIDMLVLIHVRLIVVPSPPLVLLLHLPPSGPRHDELCTANNKKANLEKTRRTNLSAYLPRKQPARAPRQLGTTGQRCPSSPCWLSAPATTSGHAGLLGVAGQLSSKNETPESQRKCFLSERPQPQSSLLGSHRGLEGTVQSRSPPKRSHN